jgi:syntaxin 5
MGQSTPFQQMQLANPDQSYLNSRSDAIQNIEATIAELGGIFQQLARMVSEQGETVQRYMITTLFLM